jgi:Na+/melibiose symporter-like transporter
VSAALARWSPGGHGDDVATTPLRHHNDVTMVSPMTSPVDLRAPLVLLRRRRDLRLLLGAGLVSMTGDWLLGVGLTYAVYALTGSTLASAVTLLASFVPQVVVGLVAGVFVDRWDRRRTMVATNLLLALGLLPLVLLEVADRIWVVYLVLAWEAVVEVFFAPAEQALLPRVVDEQDDAELVTANALNAQVQQLARLVGGALGGLAAAAGGITAVALADAATFVVATALVLRIRTTATATAAGGTDGTGETGETGGTGTLEASSVPGRLSQLRAEWLDGLRASWGHPAVRVLLLFSLVTATGEGVMGTLFAPYVRDVLHSGPAVLGAITSVQAVGGIAGGFVVAGLGDRVSPVLMLGAGSVVFGLVDLAIFLYPLLVVSPWPAVAGMVVVGVPGALAVAGLMTVLQQNTVDAQRGRVLSLLFVARSVAMVVGTTCAGFLGDAVGIIPVLAFQGVGYVVAGSMVLALLPRTRTSRPPRVAV